MNKPALFSTLCLALLSAPSSFAGVSIIQTGAGHLALSAYDQSAQQLYKILRVPVVKTGEPEIGVKITPTQKSYTTSDHSFTIVCNDTPSRSLFGFTYSTYHCTANLHLSDQEHTLDQFTISHTLASEDIAGFIDVLGMGKSIEEQKTAAEANIDAGDISTGVNFSCHVTGGQVDRCQVNMQVPFTAEEMGHHPIY